MNSKARHDFSKVITIDGGAGSGKSSVAFHLAQHLEIATVNSGQYYRALTWAALQLKINLRRADSLERNPQQWGFFFDISLEIQGRLFIYDKF